MSVSVCESWPVCQCVCVSWPECLSVCECEPACECVSACGECVSGQYMQKRSSPLGVLCVGLQQSRSRRLCAWALLPAGHCGVLSDVRASPGPGNLPVPPALCSAHHHPAPAPGASGPRADSVLPPCGTRSQVGHDPGGTLVGVRLCFRRRVPSCPRAPEQRGGSVGAPPPAQRGRLGEAAGGRAGAAVSEVCVAHRADWRRPEGLREQPQPEQQCQPAQRAELPASARAESGQLGRVLRAPSAGPARRSLLLRESDGQQAPPRAGLGRQGKRLLLLPQPRTLSSRVRGSLSLLRQGLCEPSAAACEPGLPSGGMLGSSGVPSLWVYIQGNSGEVLSTSGFCERGKIRVKWGRDSTGGGGSPTADWPSSDDCVTVNQWCFP